jgi:hypothetical protein
MRGYLEETERICTLLIEVQATRREQEARMVVYHTGSGTVYGALAAGAASAGGRRMINMWKDRPSSQLPGSAER